MLQLARYHFRAVRGQNKEHRKQSCSEKLYNMVTILVRLLGESIRASSLFSLKNDSFSQILQRKMIYFLTVFVVPFNLNV